MLARTAIRERVIANSFSKILLETCDLLELEHFAIVAALFSGHQVVYHPACKHMWQQADRMTECDFSTKEWAVQMDL
jgi:hypothetical protein